MRAFEADIPVAWGRRGLWIGGCVFAVCALLAMVWIILAPLNGAVVAQGVIKVAGDRKEIQHANGGTVQSILVKEGDQVAVGTPLVVLGDVSVQAAVESLQVSIDALAMRRARLEAETQLATGIDFPTLAAGADKERRRQLTALETAVFRTRRDAMLSQQSILTRQLTKVQEELRALARLDVVSQQVSGLAGHEVHLNQGLQARGYVSEMRVMQLQKEQLRATSQQESFRAEAARAEQRREDLRMRLRLVEADYARQANEELRETSAQLLRLEEEMRPLKDAVARQSIYAPVAGEIVNLKVKVAGAVVAPGAVVLEIVPEDQALIAEARVHPEQIADVTLGQPANLRLTAYPSRQVPLVQGRVSYIGADRMEDNMTREAYYVVRLAIDPSSLKQAQASSGEPVSLSPGMGAEVFMTTRARSALEYLFDPLLQGINRSMRER